MTSDEFIASLGDSLELRGTNRVSIGTVISTIRAELDRSVRLGALPIGTKVRVRKLGPYSLHVEIVSWAGPVFTDAYTAHLLDPKGTPPPYGHPHEFLSHDLRFALELCERIANRHNFDESRVEYDHHSTGYYLNVNAGRVEAIAMQGIRIESDLTFAELLRKAEVAAAAVVPACVKSILGPGGILAASMYHLEVLVKLAAEAAGRSVVYDRHVHRWFPVEDQL